MNERKDDANRNQKDQDNRQAGHGSQGDRQSQQEHRSTGQQGTIVPKKSSAKAPSAASAIRSNDSPFAIKPKEV